MDLPIIVRATSRLVRFVMTGLIVWNIVNGLWAEATFWALMMTLLRLDDVIEELRLLRGRV